MKHKRDLQKGQALFEFIVFIPFMLVLITTMVTIVGSINASINQVKATRGYLYAILNNNSAGINSDLLRKYKDSYGLSVVGAYAIGWREQADGENSLASCFKISTFVGEKPENEKCEDQVTEAYSTFIKVKTMYGICTGTYTLSENMGLDWRMASSTNSCALIE